MATYYLSTCLWTTKKEEFDTDEEAWNTLRTYLPNKFASLFKKEKHQCKIINPEHYFECYNAKYDTNDPVEETCEVSDFICVACGLTNDEYQKN